MLFKTRKLWYEYNTIKKFRRIMRLADHIFTILGSNKDMIDFRLTLSLWKWSLFSIRCRTEFHKRFNFSYCLIFGRS